MNNKLFGIILFLLLLGGIYLLITAQVNQYSFVFKFTGPDNLIIERDALSPLSQQLYQQGIQSESALYSFGGLLKIKISSAADPIAAQAIVENMWSNLKNSALLNDVNMEVVDSPLLETNYLLVGSANPYTFLAQLAKVQQASLVSFAANTYTLVLPELTADQAAAIKSVLSKSISLNDAQDLQTQLNKTFRHNNQQINYRVLLPNSYSLNSQGVVGLAVPVKSTTQSSLKFSELGLELLPLNTANVNCLAKASVNLAEFATKWLKEIPQLSYIFGQEEFVSIAGSEQSIEYFITAQSELTCKPNLAIFAPEHTLAYLSALDLAEAEGGKVWAITANTSKYTRLGKLNYVGLDISIVSVQSDPSAKINLPLLRKNGQPYYALIATSAEQAINTFSTLNTSNKDMLRLELEW